MVAVSGSLAAKEQPTVTRLDGSTNTATEADETVTRLMKVAEVTGGQVAYLKAYGFRDRDKNLPLKVNSVMPAASLSKVAFGYWVMELADEGQLDPDKPVYQYLPKPLPAYPNYVDLALDRLVRV
jgi:CubicO group peptidase (beta-lactamase class C family)